MIEIKEGEVMMAIEKTPLSDMLGKIDKEALRKASAERDLIYLWIAMIETFGQTETAELIQRSLQEAIDCKNNGAYTFFDALKKEGGSAK